MEQIPSPGSGAQPGHLAGWPPLPVPVYPLLGEIVHQAEWGCLWQAYPPNTLQNWGSPLAPIFCRWHFFFIRAIARDCKNLSRLLLDFCESSDQLMSATKSKTWFPPRTPRHIKEQVAGILGLPTTDRIGTYLGTPIFTTRWTASSYQYLVDNIRKRIEGWQAKYLSMAGRATFIKASITLVPIYAMKTALLSQKICHHIDTLSCHFLWGNTDHHRGCHTINWETVTLPKEVGGLGISSTRHRNQAILMNQAWRLYSDPTSLWARVLQAKYFPHAIVFTSP